MAGMFGAGISLSLCTNLVGDAPAGPGNEAHHAGEVRRTRPHGRAVCRFDGAFMKVGQWFTGKNQTTDVYYYHTNGMLAALGLEVQKLQAQLLTDDTLALLSDRALKRSRSPRPRPKILNYVEASKKHMAAYAQQPAAYAAPAQEAGQGLTHA